MQKKHVEDDVIRKLAELGVVGPAREEILKDIFGNEKEKVLGLIDSESEESFDDKLLALIAEWDKREETSKANKEPAFSTYFKSHIAKEMKRKMILPVRRQAGLGDEFFYDNATESINHRFKVKINIDIL